MLVYEGKSPSKQNQVIQVILQSLAGAPGLSQLRCHAARFTPGEAMTPTGHTTIGPGQGGSLGRFSWGLHPRKMLRGWQKPWFLYVFLGLYIFLGV